MPLLIDLSEPEERCLAARAAKDGKTVEAFAREVLVRESSPLQTMNEILAPFRKEFAESGMTEEEWGALIEAAREEVWREQQGKV